MNRQRIILIATSLAVIAVGAVTLLSSRIAPPLHATHVPRPPAISPDYTGLVIPPNIAPLNFQVNEPADAFHVTISGQRGDPIEVGTRRATIRIPIERWRALLEANAGNDIQIEVCARSNAGAWTRFDAIINTVAKEPIDRFLLYRRLDPVFRCWGEISIQQRDLSSFDDSCVVSNRSFQYDCINCHTVSHPSPDRMALQVRSQTAGPRMLLAKDGQVSDIRTATDRIPFPSAYLSWHPNGRVIAFAAIKVTQFFHTVGETRDVFDTASDLGLYLLDSNTVTTVPEIARPDRLETYPNWSPDGTYLYYCSAPQLPIDHYREVKYDLMRIAYDADRGTWGRPETLLSAADTHASVTHPRPSPDGRFLMFCLCDYGNFSIYRPESDLYLMDLASRKYHKLEVNSDRADSYHSWAGSGRWFVFSSKRRDGLLTHPYISYLDAEGHARKPFILPQEDPAFYDLSLKVFNVPELSLFPVLDMSRGLIETIRDPAHGMKAILDPRIATQPAGHSQASSQPSRY